ncbi:hypothetical protein G5C60_18135 [Streptomyces sp. HC44]|uniref:Uncharacterized protein n=1 Tax=Streptomyces scabichelini TaxID=2711217 RepID=A0A6G4V6B9_9ACTN|nr:hypothetical protein [Streptomyces scabichelini]NGO09465.1 hypothetical protein [Streptomyces scabichelini]
MTATVPTRRTRKILRLPQLRRQPSPRHAPDTPVDRGPGTPEAWLAGLRLGS